MTDTLTMRRWAKIGAASCLREIDKERAEILRAFPDLRRQTPGPASSAAAEPAESSETPAPKKRRRRYTAEGRARLSKLAKERWAAAKKAGKSRLG